MSLLPIAPETAPRSLQVFLVEDSPVIRKNLIATLEDMLPLVVVGTAEDDQGAQRWMCLADSHCDLMIIDIFLRAGSGLDVLQQAKVFQPAAKRVVLTNYATPEMRKRCLALGADRVFDKSTQLEELLSYCEDLTRSRGL